MANQILDYKKNRFVTSRVIPLFYLSAYIVDTIYFNSEYPFLGCKWTPQDSNPIHIYHKELWKAHYRNHLYRIYHGFILPVYYAIFNKSTLRLFELACVDLTAIGSWFGEEKFTYIRFFGSTIDPHVLPLYIPDKLPARQLAYQVTVEGTSRNLKESKNHMWPSFPL